MKIEYKDGLDKKVESLLDHEFEKYANQNNIICNYKTFSFIAKENNEIVGVLTGSSVYDEVHIEMLLVMEKYRNKNVGTLLIRDAENYFREKNFNYVSLVTCGFQAPQFYEKCGYKLEFKRENKENDKLIQYFFIKYL